MVVLAAKVGIAASERSNNVVVEVLVGSHS
jgi:hypothetical protein